MENIEDEILYKIKKCGRGCLFSTNDFVSYGESKSILKALERMTNSGMIVRVARGIYCFPKIDKVLGLGIIYSTFEEIAQYIAKRVKSREIDLVIVVVVCSLQVLMLQLLILYLLIKIYVITD